MLLAVTLAALLSCPPPDVRPDTSFGDLGARLDSIVRADAVRGFAGAVLVAQGDRMILDHGYGKMAGRRVAPDSRFWIASSGKQFTSAAILECMRRGLLGLDDRISKYLPNVPIDKQNITIRQLLLHLSGLGQSYASEKQANRTMAVSRMLADSMIDLSGRQFHYSNSNYQLAVAIVETVSATEYKAFVQKAFFAPVGLKNTGYSGSSGARQVLPALDSTPPRLRSSYWGGEGSYSSTRDLFRWFRALRTGKVLTPELSRMLFTPVVPIGEGKAALGWFVGEASNGEARIFTRGNEDFGANSLLYAYPARDLVIVILTHAGNAPDGTSWSRTLHGELESLLLAGK